VEAPNVSTTVCYRCLLPSARQSLVEFCGPKCVWETQQNFRRVGENSGPILRRLWTKVRDVLTRCRRPHLVANALVRLCISCFTPKTSAVKVALSCEIVERTWFGDPDFRGRVYSRFRTYILKSHLLPIVWPISVEFRSASSGVADENRKKERKNRGKI